MSASRKNIISVVTRSSCPSDCGDYASAHCHFSDTGDGKIGEVNISHSVNCNASGATYLSFSCQDVVSIVPSGTSPSDCGDYASVQCHFSDTSVGIVGEVNISLFIYCYTCSVTYLSFGRQDVISIVAKSSCPSDCGDYATAQSYFSDTITEKFGYEKTLCSKSNVKWSSDFSSSRGSVVSIKPCGTTPSDSSDYTIARCYFPDAIISKVSEVDIAASIDPETVRS